MAALEKQGQGSAVAIEAASSGWHQRSAAVQSWKSTQWGSMAMSPVLQPATAIGVVESLHWLPVTNLCRAFRPSRSLNALLSGSDVEWMKMTGVATEYAPV